MKRILFLLVFSAISFSTFAKRNPFLPSQSFGQDAIGQNTWTASAGYFEANFWGLNHYIQQFGTNHGFNLFFPTIGINRTVSVVGSGGSGSTSLNLEALIPQTISQTDSFQLKMTGWHFISSLFAYDLLPQNEKIALEIAPGIDWGEIYLKKKVLNAYTNYNNIFIAPMARIEFRVMLPPFCFGVRAVYRYDITNPDWKLHHAFPTVFPASRIYGFGFQAFVGYGKKSK